MSEACATCRFWKADPYSAGHKHTDPPYQGDPKEGRCRRYPPFIGEWQTTEADVWCGEYRAALRSATATPDQRTSSDRKAD